MNPVQEILASTSTPLTSAAFSVLSDAVSSNEAHDLREWLETFSAEHGSATDEGKLAAILHGVILDLAILKRDQQRSHLHTRRGANRCENQDPPPHPSRRHP